MHNIFLLLTCITVFHAVPSLQEEATAKNEVNGLPLHEIIETYASIFHHQDTGCFCRQNFCECCEDKIGNVCLSIGYYEVFDIPAAFGVNITNKGELFLKAVVNTTDLPCLHLPYIDLPFKLCLLLHRFNKTNEFTRVMFDIKVKMVFTTFQIRLGCLSIPRLHPHINSSKLTIYHSVLNQMGIEKHPDDLTGLEYCSSGNSKSSQSYFRNIYILLLLLTTALKISKS